MTSLKTSTTTQNVALGVGGTGLFSVGTVRLLREVVPGYIPWGPDMDEAVVTLLTALFAPFVARFLAFWRDPIKKKLSDSRNGR